MDIYIYNNFKIVKMYNNNQNALYLYGQYKYVKGDKITINKFGV